MEKSEKTPETLGVFSKLFFLWVIPLFRKKQKRSLTEEDLYSIPCKDESKYLGDMVSRVWNEQLEISKATDNKPSLTKVFIVCFGKEFLIEFFILAVNMWVFRIVQPICLQLLIRSFRDDPEGNGHDRIVYASLISIAAAVNVFCISRQTFVVNFIAMKCRVCCSSLIYRKILKLDTFSEGKVTVGQIINLLANDVNRFDRMLLHLQYLIITPVQLIICFYLLWKDLGVYCTAGLLGIILSLPIQYLSGKMIVRFRKRMEESTDERIRIMSEIISSIRVIKMYTWENPFSALVNAVRRYELDIVRKRFNAIGLVSNLNELNYKLLPFCMILAYTLCGYNLAADIVFNVILICNIINYSLGLFVNAISVGLGELNSAVQRIEEFLLLKEHKCVDPESKVLDECWDATETAIHLKSASASWVKDKVCLTNLTLEVKRNTLYSIIGPIGSGKSSFLQYLIEEMPFSSGQKCINGKISYSSQEAWIFDGTVRQNIVFGSPFDEKRYDEVTRATSLVEDFEKFPYGDLSRVGERGIILSGGQKARIGLARALYYEADIYLLDDPLSAVDSVVGNHIFEECFKTFLKNKTTLLVTHQLQFLPQADQIILLEDGKIVCKGSYYELTQQKIDFLKFLETDKGKSEKVYKETSEKQSTSISVNYNTCEPTTVEEKYCGSVSWKSNWEYYISSGDYITILIIICICFVMYQAVLKAIDYWLLKWTNAEQLIAMMSSNLSSTSLENGTSNAVDHKKSAMNTKSIYLYEYSGFIFIASILGILGCLAYYSFMNRICTTIHDKMLSAVMRAPIKFFDENPSGRIMNRFAKDLCQIDELLPLNIYETITVFCRVVGVVIIVITTNYFMILPSFGIFIILWFLQKLCTPTSIDLRRIEGISKNENENITCNRIQYFTINEI